MTSMSSIKNITMFGEPFLAGGDGGVTAHGASGSGEGDGEGLGCPLHGCSGSGWCPVRYPPKFPAFNALAVGLAHVPNAHAFGPSSG
eukprot:SAG31_NODE_207_length_20316_cov_20.465400_3_plen_87_part_00